MARPYSINITRVKCYSTNNYTGEDQLYGKLGNIKFQIGNFSAGNDYNLDINQVVPAGEIYLFIYESDVVGNDEIGMIDLSQYLDFQASANVQGRGANYDFSFYVTSVSTDTVSNADKIQSRTK